MAIVKLGEGRGNAITCREAMAAKTPAALAQPIFEAGGLSGQLDYSKARYEELLQNYRKAVISAFSNVEDALAATRRTAEQQESQQVAVAKARRAYDIAQLQYGVGSTDLLTVLNTENALFSANDLLAQIRIARMQALVSLFNALGGGWQDSASQGVATSTSPPSSIETGGRQNQLR